MSFDIQGLTLLRFYLFSVLFFYHVTLSWANSNVYVFAAERVNEFCPSTVGIPVLESQKAASYSICICDTFVPVSQRNAETSPNLTERKKTANILRKAPTCKIGMNSSRF